MELIDFGILIVLLLVGWFCVEFVKQYFIIKEQIEAAERAAEQAANPQNKVRIVSIELHTDEVVGTLNGSPLYRYYRTSDGNVYEFDGVIDSTSFLERSSGMREILVQGKLIYKLVELPTLA